MASPAIQSALATANAASGTAFAVSYPATVSAGSTLICWVSTNAATVTFPAGWTKLSATDYTGTSGDRANVAWRKATGSESGTFTVTLSAGVKAAACVWSCTGAADPTVTPPVTGTLSSGSGGNLSDPPPCTPAGGSADYLFLALTHAEGAVTVTAWPTNYTLNQISEGTTGGSAGSNVRTAGAGRQLTATTDNPGTFTFSGTIPWMGQTVALYPAPPSGTAWTATPADSVTMSDGQSFGRGEGVADTVALSDAASSGYPAIVLSDGPAAYYRMGESSGQPQDSSGFGNHTTTSNGSPVYGQTGVTPDGNKAIEFDGSEWFTAPDSATLDVGDVFTVEAWLRMVTVGGAQTIASKGIGAFQVMVNAGRIVLNRNDTAVICQSTAVISDTTTYHHVVVTKSGATVKMYLDGVDVTGTVTDSTCGNTTTPLEIGNTSAEGNWLQAVADEVAVYPSALSSARVAAHYAAVPPPGVNWTRTVTDTVSVTDTQAFATGEGVADSVTMSDAVTFDRVKTQADSVTMSDGLAFDRSVTVADTVALADSPTTSRGISQPVPDTLAVADSATTAAGKGVQVDDTLAVADAQTFQRAVVWPISDTVALADVVSFGVGLTLADTVSLTDLIAQAEEIHIGDTLALTDLADPVKTSGGTSWTQPVTDTLGLADLLRFDRAFTVTDTVALTDGQAFQRDVAQAVTDAVALADLLGLGRGLTVADVLTLADLADPVKTTGGVALTQPVVDVLAVADLLTSQAAFSRTVPDTVAVADLVAAVRGLERALADTLTLADAVRLGRGLGLADVVSPVDALVSQAAYVRVLADLVTVLDTVDPRLRAAAAVLNLADAIYLGDQAADRVYAGTTQVWP